MLELIIAALMGGGLASAITAWAMRRKIGAEASEIESRIHRAVFEAFQGRIDFLCSQVEMLQGEIEDLQKENKLVRKKNSELEDRLGRYERQSDTGFHKVVP